MRRHWYVFASLLGAIAYTEPALAQQAASINCPELSTAQRIVGLLTFEGMMKFFGLLFVTAGVGWALWGTIVRVAQTFKVLLEVLGYVVSAALVGAKFWLPLMPTGTDTLAATLIGHQNDLALAGCILFAVSYFASVFIHRLKSDDPKPTALLFAVVWGIVAMLYNDTYIGGLTMLAMMTLLGFTVIVGHLSYGFGFEDEEVIGSTTVAALIITILGVVQRTWYPSTAPEWISVFGPGALLTGSFVACTGLLIMSADRTWFTRTAVSYFLLQPVTFIAFNAAMVAGLVLLPDSPLYAMGYTFLVLYLAAKPGELRHLGVNYLIISAALILTGGILYGGWFFMGRYRELITQFITTLPQ